MGRKKGQNSNLWKYPDELDHLRHIAFLKARAQANYRQEPWTLTIGDFFEIWRREIWCLRGKKPTELCMIRVDRAGPWSIDNCVVVTRYAQLVRDKNARKFPEEKLPL
jgi:hypothetical protein